jgi:prophage regulatory protein
VILIRRVRRTSHVSIRAPDRLGIGRMQKTSRVGTIGGQQGARQTIKAQQPRRTQSEGAETARADPTPDGPVGGHGEPNRPLAQPIQLPSLIETRPRGTDFGSKDFVRRAIRRRQLKQMVPLADTTIYEMEQRGEFPRRFYLTPRCVAWDAGEIESWLAERRRSSSAYPSKQVHSPDVRKRTSRPVRG